MPSLLTQKDQFWYLQQLRSDGQIVHDISRSVRESALKDEGEVAYH